MRFLIAPLALAVAWVHAAAAQAPATAPNVDEATRAAVQRYRAAADPAEAKRAFEELRARASTSPQAALACGLLAGQQGSVVGDPKVATECLRAGAKAGSAEAQHLLAAQLLAETGPDRAERRAEAEKLLVQSARGLPESVYLLAQLRADRAADPKAARAKVAADAANAGYAPAQREVAHHLVVAGQQDEAMAWLEKAAAQGDAEAGYELATLLAERKRDADVPRIVALLEDASKSGSARADYALGQRYLTADGVGRDTEKAAALFRRAAAAGFVDGQYAWAYALLEGVGTPADEALALKWFEALARQDHANAMFALGNAHANGWGTGKSMDMAYRWYCRAAQKGHASALKLVRRSRFGRDCPLPAQPTDGASPAPARAPETSQTPTGSPGR